MTKKTVLCNVISSNVIFSHESFDFFGLLNICSHECKLLNSSEKKVDYSRIFEGRLCEMKYILNILEENKIQFELTQAQNSSSWRH